jgi:cytosine/uracil/thiamine/allantoin permease
MAADSVRHRGAWPGARRGVNLPGLAAWAVGLAVGLVPIVAEAARWDAGTRFQPSAVFAFLASFVVYLVLAGLGAESPLEPPALSEPDASAEVEVG